MSTKLKADELEVGTVVADPAAPAVGVALYAKAAAGIDQLFARVPAGTIFQLSGVQAIKEKISPPVVAGPQHNYNPPGLDGTTIIRQDVDLAGASLTGLMAQEDGRLIVVQNVGAGSLELTGESASSDPANRFAKTVTIPTSEAATIVYDATSARWRPTSYTSAFSNVGLPQRAADPSTLASNVALYAKQQGGVSQLFAKSDDGEVNQLTSVLQRVSEIRWIPSAFAPTPIGLNALQVAGSLGYVAVADAGVLGQTVRGIYTSSAAINQAAGINHLANFLVSGITTAGASSRSKGGWQVVFEFTVEDAVLSQPGTRMFVGVESGADGTPSSAEPSSLNSVFGFGASGSDNGGATLQLYSAPSNVNKTTTDLGLPHATNKIYRATIECPPNQTANPVMYNWRIDDVETGDSASGTTRGVDLGSLLSIRAWRATNASSSAAVKIGLGLIQIYKPM